MKKPTLRDEFKLESIAQSQMAAMSRPFIDENYEVNFADPEVIAKLSIEYAKALLKELDSEKH